MGATTWRYFVPYKENIQQALEELRQKEFEAGRYGLADHVLQEVENKAREMKLSEEKLEEFKVAYLKLQAMKGKAKKKPASVKQLLKSSKDAGTHSIIDIFSITNSFDKDVSGTISEAELFSFFGTNRPTRKMVSEKLNELSNIRGRQLCTYIIIYEKDTPVELFFTGYSGD